MQKKYNAKENQAAISPEVAALLKQIEIQRQALEKSIGRINRLRQMPLETNK